MKKEIKSIKGVKIPKLPKGRKIIACHYTQQNFYLVVVTINKKQNRLESFLWDCISKTYNEVVMFDLITPIKCQKN